MSLSFDLIAVGTNTIRAPIVPQWTINLSVGKLAINTPARWSLGVNFIRVRFIDNFAVRKPICWLKYRFEIGIHYEWSLVMVLAISELNLRTQLRHHNPN